jgi:ribosomal RNA-processing protein 12
MLLDSTDESTAVSCAYLLSITMPGVNVQVLRAKFEHTSQSLTSCLEAYSATQAPLVRSVLACMQVLLLAQDARAWTQSTQCTALLHQVIALSTDQRPKVRKRAHEAVRQVLTHPPPPTSLHPASGACLEFSSRFFMNNRTSNKEERGARDTQTMHLLAFLRTILPGLRGFRLF